MGKQEKKEPKAPAAPKNKSFTIEANRAKRKARHEKRMKKQSEKVLKVPHGTGRRLNATQRNARKKQHHAEKTYWQGEFAALAERVRIAELQRKQEERAAKRNASNNGIVVGAE